MPSVLISVPVMRGQIEVDFMMSLMAMRRDLWNAHIQHHILTNESSLISDSRNKIAERNQDLAHDYLMWIDSDIKFPAYGVERLLKADKDIIGGLYFRKVPPHEPLVFDLNEDGGFYTRYALPKENVFEVSAIATGFLLVNRRVFDAFTPEIVKEIGKPFDMGRNPVTLREEGEDISFCRRALKLGFKLWCDQSIPLGHLGPKTYDRADYQEMMTFKLWKEKKETYSNDIPGWMSKPELNWLHKTAEGVQSIVEIGSWKGRSAHAMLSTCPGTVWAVDHFKWGERLQGEHPITEIEGDTIYNEFMKNVGHFPNLKVLRMDSLEAAKQFEDKSVDMVFIDGGHTYAECLADIDAWLPKTKRVICGHDYNFMGVQEAVTERFGIPDTVESIWIKELK